MIITKQQADEMMEAAKPLMLWMANNCHPHCEARVDGVSVELFEGAARRETMEFVDRGISEAMGGGA